MGDEIVVIKYRWLSDERDKHHLLQLDLQLLLLCMCVSDLNPIAASCIDHNPLQISGICKGSQF